VVGGKAPVVFPLKDCFCFYLYVFIILKIAEESLASSCCGPTCDLCHLLESALGGQQRPGYMLPIHTELVVKGAVLLSLCAWRHGQDLILVFLALI